MRHLFALVLTLLFMLNGALAKGRPASGTNSRSTQYSRAASSKPKAARRASAGATGSAPKSATDQHVNGYTRKDGKRVGSYMRTAPNGTQKDNFSTKGNVNPYTGKKGTKAAKK
jgi:hypothetical protein